jgi:hypothetical protein
MITLRSLNKKTEKCLHWQLLGLLLWLPCLLLLGQSPTSIRLRERINAFPYTVVSLGTNVNLPQSQVASMVIHPVTKEMIISTAKGLVSYDGRSVTAYDIGHAYDGYIFGQMFSRISMMLRWGWVTGFWLSFLNSRGHWGDTQQRSSGQKTGIP